MRKAIIAIEDYRFYQHGALDLKGTLRAFVTNQANDGTIQGGSSITQQMVKMTLVNQAKTKAEQQAATGGHLPAQDPASCATRSRSRRSTPRTGSSSATSTSPTSATAPTASRPPPGTTSPSRASQLNLREAALLAGLVKNPTGYDPTNNPDRGHASAATSCSTGWPSSTSISAAEAPQADERSGSASR